MTEYTLNKLTSRKLAELAFNSASFLADVTRSSFKLNLYYLGGHFIEVSYRKKMFTKKDAQWQICAVNHFPDTPENTHYLTIYLTQITVAVDTGRN